MIDSHRIFLVNIHISALKKTDNCSSCVPHPSHIYECGCRVAVISCLWLRQVWVFLVCTKDWCRDKVCLFHSVTLYHYLSSVSLCFCKQVLHRDLIGLFFGLLWLLQGLVDVEFCLGWPLVPVWVPNQVRFNPTSIFNHIFIAFI